MLRIALGTAQLGFSYGIANRTGQVPREEAAAMLRLASAAGLDTLDTAMAYGEAEARLGEAGIQDFRVVTKLPAIPEGLGDVGGWIHEQARASLRRLGISAVYGLLLHRSQQLAGPQGKPVARALEQLKAEGLVKKTGISIYSPTELETVIPSSAVDLVQAPLNLIDRRLHASGWLGRLRDAGIEVHARSVFLQGLLLMPREAIPEKFARWNSLWDSWHAWKLDRQVSAARACIGFAQSFPEVDRIVVGADGVAQLREIVDAANSEPVGDWPAIATNDENLVNPSKWDGL